MATAVFCPFPPLVGGEGDSASSFWVSPLHSQAPLLLSTRGSLSTCSPSILVLLRDSLHPSPSCGPGCIHPRACPLLLQNLPATPEPSQPLPQQHTRGRGLFPTWTNQVFTSLLLGSATVLPRPVEKPELSALLQTTSELDPASPRNPSLPQSSKDSVHSQLPPPSFYSPAMPPPPAPAPSAPSQPSALASAYSGLDAQLWLQSSAPSRPPFGKL